MDNIPLVQPNVEQLIIQDPQVVDDLPVDEVDLDILELNEQLVDQHDPSRNVELTLRRFAREKKSAISGDYVVYLQEFDFNVEVVNDLETFSQAVSSNESKLWFNGMKDEMTSMASNEIWDLVELPNGAKPIGCKWVFKTKKDLLGIIK